MDAYLRANQDLWNLWTPYHVRSTFYDVDGLKSGSHRLDPIVLAGLGDVRGTTGSIVWRRFLTLCSRLVYGLSPLPNIPSWPGLFFPGWNDATSVSGNCPQARQSCP